MTMMMKFVILTTLYTAVNAALPAIEEAITSAEEATIDTAMPTCEDNNKYMDEFGKVGAWRDSSSYTCKDYVDLRWCACADGVCAVQDKRYAGYGAEENCCACGRKLESEEGAVFLDKKEFDLVHHEISEAPEEGSIDGTTPECGLKNTYGTECLDEWKTQRWGDETLNKHCVSTEPAYHINCQSCVWCDKLIKTEEATTAPNQDWKETYYLYVCQNRKQLPSEDYSEADVVYMKKMVDEHGYHANCDDLLKARLNRTQIDEEKEKANLTQTDEEKINPCQDRCSKDCNAASMICHNEDCDNDVCWTAEEKCKLGYDECFDCWLCYEEEYSHESPDPCTKKCGERWDFKSCAAKSLKCRHEHDCDSISDEVEQEQCYMKEHLCMLQWLDSCGGEDGCFQCYEDQHRDDDDDECRTVCGGSFTAGSCTVECAEPCMTGSKDQCKKCAIEWNCEECMKCHMPITNTSLDETKLLKTLAATTDTTKLLSESSFSADATRITIDRQSVNASVTKFKESLASVMVVMIPDNCNVKECAHWNCKKWCYCFEHYGHLIQPWLDLYAASAGCEPDGTECICDPTPDEEGPGPTEPEINIYDVPNKWIDPLWDPSPLDKIRERFIISYFTIPEPIHDAPHEDGDGGWGDPTDEEEGEWDQLLRTIEMYNTNPGIRAMDLFVTTMPTLLRGMGKQANRPLVQQFVTMMMTIKQTWASTNLHDHNTARQLEIQLDTNLKSLRKANRVNLADM